MIIIFSINSQIYTFSPNHSFNLQTYFLLHLDISTASHLKCCTWFCSYFPLHLIFFLCFVSLWIACPFYSVKLARRLEAFQLSLLTPYLIDDLIEWFYLLKCLLIISIPPYLSLYISFLLSSTASATLAIYLISLYSLYAPLV